MQAKDRILVAADVPNRAQALRLRDGLKRKVGGFKIGKQLFTAEGPSLVREFVDGGERVFLDLKYHDIPNTVAGAVAAAVELGVWMINVHASGGAKMMEAAAKFAAETASKLGVPKPLMIAVTVLTSFDDDQLQEVGVFRTVWDQVLTLAQLAQDSGMDGVVASPQEIELIRRACGNDFVVVTPGIRPAPPEGEQAKKDDQARVMTPREAVSLGASYLVIGRPITGAPDMARAASDIVESIGFSIV